jgi:DNA ligase-1
MTDFNILDGTTEEGHVKYATLFHKDTKDKTRVWWMEREWNLSGRYRTIAGLLHGQKVASAWKQATPKNVGKVNATTADEQAHAEIQSQYTKKIDRKYHINLEDIEEAKIFAPMLAQKYDPAKFVWNKFACEYVSQPKLDGIRCIAKADGLFSRQGKPFNLPHIREGLEGVFTHRPDAILDGELYHHLFKDDFNSIVSLVKKETRTDEEEKRCRDLIQYHVYDMYGEDNFHSRFQSLDRLVWNHAGPAIVIVPSMVIEDQESLDADYAHHLEMGYEGQIIRLDAPYENKRSKNLLKRKEFQDEEFELTEVQEGLGNWAGYAKRALCKLPDGRSFGAGIKGTQEFTKELLGNWRKYEGVTVRYFARTPDGIPRFPVAVAWHESLKNRD